MELAPSSRFVAASDADVIKAAEGVVPENASWGLRNFDKWVKETGKATSSEPVQQDLLHCNPAIVSKWLRKFILETRQESGKPYPPKSSISSFRYARYSYLCHS